MFSQCCGNVFQKHFGENVFKTFHLGKFSFCLIKKKIVKFMQYFSDGPSSALISKSFCIMFSSMPLLALLVLVTYVERQYNFQLSPSTKFCLWDYNTL